jgi:NADH dehydrogenase
MTGNKKIIIVGGGFAGLRLARELNGSSFDVLLIDRQNHHQFQPLFYQVASARLEPSTISFPFRKVFQHSRNVKFLMAEVKRINAEENSIITSTGNYYYDYLVIATGCRTNYFGNEELSRYTLPMKSTIDALEIRNRILMGFEDLMSVDGSEAESLLNIVIVGAGPTGVELAGAFAEMKKNILPKDYPGYDFSRLKIFLIEGSDNTLNSLSDLSKKASRKYLTEMGVTVRTGTFVNGYDGKIVKLNNGENIPCRNVIWAAGITGDVIPGINACSVTKSGRYIVDRFNKILGYKNVYALGDIAYMETPKYPHGHPQVANVAINQGKNLSHNLKACLRGGKLTEYEYHDLGTMATVGKHRAVVDLPFISFKGYFAWFVWMFLHLMLILSVRNKLMIFIDWAWNYLTNDSSLRLILSTGTEKKDNLKKGLQ